MPYTPTVWQSGDIVTSEKLNKLEQGVADATSEQIIDSWLEENISQETGYALDRTLTLQNAAAPADMVGDLKSALVALDEQSEKKATFSGTVESKAFVNYPYKLKANKQYVITNKSENVDFTNFYGKTGSTTHALSGRHILYPNNSMIVTSLYDETDIQFYVNAIGSYKVEIIGADAIRNDIYELSNTTDNYTGKPVKSIYNFHHKYTNSNNIGLPITAGRYTIICDVPFAGTFGCFNTSASSWKGRVSIPLESPVKKVSFTATDSGTLYMIMSGANTWEGNFTIFDTTDNEDYAIVNAMIGYGQIAYGNGYANAEFSDSFTPDIMFIGDSQTQQHKFVDRFHSLYKKALIARYGYGGDGAKIISMMQGGTNLYVKPFTIPATTTAVTCEFTSDIYGMETVEICRQSTEGFTSVMIDGIAGSVSYDSTNHVNKFTRAEAGEAHEITRPVLVRSSYYNDTKRIMVIEVGTNDSGGTPSEFVPMVIRCIRSMIDHNNFDKYLVLGLTAKSVCATVADVNETLAQEFGEHFIDIRSYLIAYGLEDQNITPTEQDLTDISNGEIPTSLRSDAVHFNQAGGNVVGDLIYNHGKELGYWS